jgi:hypothetical protein
MEYFNLRESLSGLNAFVTEPERNDGDVDPSLQQMESRCMPHDMGRNSLHA